MTTSNRFRQTVESPDLTLNIPNFECLDSQTNEAAKNNYTESSSDVNSPLNTFVEIETVIDTRLNNEPLKQPIQDNQSPQMLKSLELQALSSRTSEANAGNISEFQPNPEALEDTLVQEPSGFSPPPFASRSLLSPQEDPSNNYGVIHISAPAEPPTEWTYEEFVLIFPETGSPDGWEELMIGFHEIMNPQENTQVERSHEPYMNMEPSGNAEIPDCRTMAAHSCEIDILLSHRPEVTSVTSSLSSTCMYQPIIDSDKYSSTTASEFRPLRVPVSVTTFTSTISNDNAAVPVDTSSNARVYPISVHKAHVLCLSMFPVEDTLIVKLKRFFVEKLGYSDKNIEFHGNLRANEARALLRARVLDVPKNEQTDMLYVAVIGRVLSSPFKAIYMRDQTKWTDRELHYDLYFATDDEGQTRAHHLLAGKPIVVAILVRPDLPRTPACSSSAKSAPAAQHIATDGITSPLHLAFPSPSHAQLSGATARDSTAADRVIGAKSSVAATAENLESIESSRPEADSPAQSDYNKFVPAGCDELRFLSSYPEKLIDMMLSFHPQMWVQLPIHDMITKLNSVLHKGKAGAVNSRAPTFKMLIEPKRCTLCGKLYIGGSITSAPPQVNDE